MVHGGKKGTTGEESRAEDPRRRKQKEALNQIEGGPRSIFSFLENHVIEVEKSKEKWWSSKGDRGAPKGMCKL